MKKEGRIKGFFREYFHSRGLAEMYVSYFFRSFAQSLIGVFIPIFLLTTGHSLMDIGIYYLIFYTCVSIFMPLGMVLISKIGAKKMMALGTLTLIAYYPLLNQIERGLSYYWPAFVYGIGVAFYWSAYHLAFTKFSDNNKEGKELSIFRISGVIAGMVGPLLGGLFIYQFSFGFVFFIVSVLLFISTLPLIFSKDFKIPSNKFSAREIAKQDTPRKALVYQISGVLGIVSGVFWPIFIYLNVKNVIPLGIISSLTSFLMIFVIFYIGRKADSDEKRTLLTGVFLNSPSWISRLFLLSPMGLFFSNFYGDLTNPLISIPFQKMIYEKARVSKNKRDYFLFREFNLQIGRLILLVAIIFISNLFWIFVLAFFITFGHLILIRKRKRKKENA
jgi:MFS family permease